MVCVTVRKYVATPADVVDVREHKFHGTLTEYAVALSHALGATLAFGLCCYALWSQGPSNLTLHGNFGKNGSQSLLSKNTNLMEGSMKIVGNGREASFGGII